MDESNRHMFASVDLRCIECGRLSDERARGWRTYLADDPDEPSEDPLVESYCPHCATREFGPVLRHRSERSVS